MSATAFPRSDIKEGMKDIEAMYNATPEIESNLAAFIDTPKEVHILQLLVRRGDKKPEELEKKYQDVEKLCRDLDAWLITGGPTLQKTGEMIREYLNTMKTNYPIIIKDDGTHNTSSVPADMDVEFFVNEGLEKLYDEGFEDGTEWAWVVHHYLTTRIRNNYQKEGAGNSQAQSMSQLAPSGADNAKGTSAEDKTEM